MISPLALAPFKASAMSHTGERVVLLWYSMGRIRNPSIAFIVMSSVTISRTTNVYNCCYSEKEAPKYLSNYINKTNPIQPLFALMEEVACAELLDYWMAIIG